MFFTPAYAQAAGSGGFGSTFGSLIPLLLIFVIMYFIIIRPQQKKAKEHDAMLKKLKIGDKVSTASGIVGVITQIKQNSVSLRSADSKLEMLLPSVDRVLKEKDSPEA